MGRYQLPQNQAELNAEIEDRLARRGVRPCACGRDCPAYRRWWDHVAAGLAGAAAGVPAMGGEAAAARLGYHRDGRSRAAVQVGRLGGLARAARRVGR
jgi:hypothetical protein